MPTAHEFVQWISEHFQANKARVASIVSGPKRETWFSAETIAALNHRIEPHPDNSFFPTFACYGEQEYNTVFSSLGVDRADGGGRKRPDVVIYSPDIGLSAILAIIEMKLCLRGDKHESTLNDLHDQMENAHSLCPEANIIGLVFFIDAPFLTPDTCAKGFRAVEQSLEKIFPAPIFKYVEGFSGTFIVPLIEPQFVYPAFYTSVALFAIEYADTKSV